MNTTTNETTNLENQEFDNQINFLGRTTSIIALIGMLSVPFVVTKMFDIQLDWASAIPIAGSLIAMFAPVAIVENISYYAIIGAGGVYLSCITGNIMNMKLPCALSGMKIANAEPGSRKGDIISILSIGVSSIVTTTILFLGMLIVGKFFAPLLNNPILKPGFENIMPSLMGAISIPFVINSPWLAAFPILVTLSLYLSSWGTVLFNPFYQSYTLLAIMVASVLVAYFMHKKGLLEKKV